MIARLVSSGLTFNGRTVLIPIYLALTLTACAPRLAFYDQVYQKWITGSSWKKELE